MSLSLHLALVFHVFIAVAVMVMACGRRGLWPSWYRPLMMQVPLMTLFAAAVMARYQDVFKRFYSQPVIGDVIVDSQLCSWPCTSALEQHNGATDEPPTSAVSS